MAYTLSAFIAKAGLFTPYQALNPCITIVPLPQGFEMILNDTFLKEAIGAQPEFAQAQPHLAALKQAQFELEQAGELVEEGFPRWLTGPVISFGLSCSSHQLIAYVEAEFFGGSGEQYGVLWQDKQVILLPSTNGLNSSRYSNEEHDGPINSVLRGLGVRVDKYDEFASLGLGLERGVRGWFRRFNPDANTGDCNVQC